MHAEAPVLAHRPVSEPSDAALVGARVVGGGLLKNTVNDDLLFESSTVPQPIRLVLSCSSARCNFDTPE